MRERERKLSGDKATFNRAIKESNRVFLLFMGEKGKSRENRLRSIFNFTIRPAANFRIFMSARLEQEEERKKNIFPKTERAFLSTDYTQTQHNFTHATHLISSFGPNSVIPKTPVNLALEPTPAGRLFTFSFLLVRIATRPLFFPPVNVCVGGADMFFQCQKADTAEAYQQLSFLFSLRALICHDIPGRIPSDTFQRPTMETIREWN